MYNRNIVVIPSKRRHVGRRIIPAHLHQKYIMRQLSKEYIEFEQRHLRELENLWFKTNDLELRQVILDARKVLKCIFDGDDQVFDSVR